MNIKLLSSEELSLKWGTIAPLIEEALSHGDGAWTTHALFLGCLSAHNQCWVLLDEEEEIQAAAITRIIQNPGYKELCVVTCTAHGFLGDYGKEVLEYLEDFARQSDCEKLSIVGRKGWARFLPEEYETPYQVYIRRL